MFRIALVVLIASAVSAKLISPDGSIPAGSSLGKRLLSMAKVVTPSRHLNNNNGADYSWIAAYSLRYLGCSALVQVSGQNGNNNNNNNNNGQSSSMLYHEQLARFALCPSTSCGTCSGGGEYVLNMATFVDAYTEAQLTALEYACETVRGNCVCNDDTVDDKTCESACYTKANMTKCINYNGNGDQDFEVQRYLECESKSSHM